MKRKNMPHNKLRRQINADNRSTGRATTVKYTDKVMYGHDHGGDVRDRMEDALTMEQGMMLLEAKNKRTKIDRRS